jgi:predicted O-methyltransferase YrrM
MTGFCRLYVHSLAAQGSISHDRRAPEAPARLPIPEKIDLVLLDGAKSLYPEILTLLESRLKPGALIVADNADMSPHYLQRLRALASGYMSVAFGEDVELSMRLG